MLGTATITSGPTLTAEVNVVRETNYGFEVEVITGTGGWNSPGKVLDVRKSITTLHDDPASEVVEEPAELTAPVTGEEYMTILLARQAAYVSRNPGTLLPLLEWFIRDGDEDFVQLPDVKPARKRETTPRVYRTAASLREERDKVAAQVNAFGADDGPCDPAVVNLSPYSRSKAARNAGRRRFAKMDNDLIKFTALTKRLDALNSRIISAEARERKAAQ